MTKRKTDNMPMLRIGQRVRVLSTIDLQPYAMVRAGETGTVSRVTPETGDVDIKLDKEHEGLNEYSNTMWLHPPFTHMGMVERIKERTNPAVWLRRGVCAVGGTLLLLGMYAPRLAHAIHAPVIQCEELPNNLLGPITRD